MNYNKHRITFDSVEKPIEENTKRKREELEAKRITINDILQKGAGLKKYDDNK